MSFDVAAEAYDAFMGRYSRLLSPQLADLACVASGQRVLDVGCGPGALTGELVTRLGAASVAAIDPSAQFVEAARARNPGVDVRRATADALPFADAAFDAALAQLVVHFLPDPVAGITEMARVTRPAGMLAASVWDHAGGLGPLGMFWEVARELDRDVVDESDLPGARAGHLTALFEAAGLRDVVEISLVADLEHPSFEAWWEPFTRGVGPAGAYTVGLDPERRVELRERLRARLPTSSFVIPARAWAVRGQVAPPDRGDRAVP